MKITFKIFFILFIPIIFFLLYFTTVGIETERFNKQIQIKIKEINKDFDIELNEVKLILNPFKFKIKAKTIGPRIFIQNKSLDIESIKTDISLKSFLVNEFSLKTLDISTKTVEIKDLLSLYRTLYQAPELIVLEKLFKIKGYLIANLKFEFNSNGKLKENYNFKGLCKDLNFNYLMILKFIN